YALASGVSGLGLVLDDSWTGTVSFTEAQLTTLGGSWKSGSTVSLTGVTGSLSSDLIEGKVVLKKGTGDWGFGQTETSGTQYTNLENTLTGDGNLGVKSGSVDSTFNLNGNIDGWTGNFIVATDADTDLNLGGSGPKTVHGTVGGSNLVVNVNADTTFEGALNVAEINVNDSKTATLKADSTADRVDTSNGSLKVDNGKTLTVTGFTGPEGLKLGAGASIVLQGTAYMGGEDYGYVGGTVANSEGTDQDVTIHNANITVTGTTLRVNGGSGFTVDNKLVNATLAVENGLPSTVTLNNVQDSLEVAGNLEIGPGGLLKVANDGSKQTLNISDGTTLTLANDTTLDADLTLNRGATLKLDYNMGSPVATTLNGGGLTLYKGLTLSGDLYETLKGLSVEGESVTLFSNVNTIVFDGATTATVDASTYFTNLLDLEGDFTFNYDEGLLSIVYSESSSRQLVWDGTDAEHRWVAYEPETITPEVKDWYQPSTETETHFVQGDTATFGADADIKVVNLSAGETTAKMVTIKESADYEFVADAAGSKLSATRFEVKEGATLSKSGAGTLILEIGENVTVDAAGLFVDEGELVIGTAEMPGKLAIDNGGVMEIAEGATLRTAALQDSEGSLIAVCGTLNVASGSLHAIHALEGSTVVISNVNGVSAGTLAIDSDTTLHGLENHGTLDVGTHSLTLEEAAAQGGNVTAGTLNLAGNGNSFGNLKVNTIHYAYGAEGAGELGAVNVDTIAANGGFPVITLDLADTMGAGGSLAPTNRTSEAETYTLIHADGQTLSTSNFMLGGNTLALLVQNGLVHEGAGLETDGSNITLTVGGQDVTWNTDKDVTEWGYTVVSNDHITAGGDTFNGVEHLVVDASRIIDVTGSGSEPGLRVRNITGLDGRTITFTGTEDDTVNLVTNEETSSNVNVAAENINLQVGLNQLDDIDPADYEYLHVGSVTLTNADMAVNPEATLSVDTLNGDVNSGLQGVVIVEAKGGTYNGGYEDATVILHEDADQALAAGEGLTVMGLGLARITYSGAETHMDGIEGIGLRVMLNDEYADNSHRTLTLDNEYSYIVDGALGVGLSAIESGITLDSEAAPDLLRAEHLEMTGSTLYIYQALSDGAALVMDVNDGGYKRGLLLAMLGAENTTADAVQLQGDLFFKYYQNPRLENGRVLVDRRTDYFTLVTEPTSENGQAGAGMLDDALLYNNPQATQQGGDLAVVMTALEQGGYSHANADKVMAAMSGASQAAMGAAWNRDVDRQLRAIRNRTTQMGLAECTRHEGLPYFNAWINAEGDYAKLGADGTLAGYKLTSWGGTLGVDVDFTSRFTMGVAVTAMSGDFTADSAERAEGDLDRLYVSVFGRYTRRAWTHTFVATLGMADTKLERTVDYGYGSYNADSSSDGKAFGLMYEVGYVTALNEDSSTCLQPVLNLSYRHSSLAGCGEQSQSDAALRLGNADANVFTAAIGARLQSAVGTSVYNRTSIFEGRVMLKFDTGDRDVAANNSFVGVPGGRAAKSTEAGLFGVEVGAGLTIPLSENAGAIFFDVSGDFRAKDTEVNGTVGYRYNF
ncbi:MAG: autotransporter domain-containing protein, partial [Akkermansia sp.]|nr:autotransporter domain-containing protein [Akkermansia sp.]